MGDGSRQNPNWCARCPDRVKQARHGKKGLDTLWRFAAHWYDGRLEPGYRRREPGEASEYLRSVGLAAPFWGLPDE